MKKSIAVVLVLLSLTGCAHVGEPIDQLAVSQIVKGKTTKAELLDMFGPPLVVSSNSDNTETLAWSHVSIGAFGSGYQQQSFTAVLNEAGVVTSYTNSTVNPNR